MTNEIALLIATGFAFATGHWITGIVFLVVFLIFILGNYYVNDKFPQTWKFW